MKKTILSVAAATMILASGANALTKMEKHSLTLANKFIKGNDKSFYRPDGGVVFLYGGTLPSVLTAPLRLTDIQLQAGEVIKEVQLGDTVRWQVSPSISGSGSTQVSHVIVKPTDSRLETTLDIFTDRRSYHINLKSTQTKYFPIVSFGYPDELQHAWDNYHAKVKENNFAKALPVYGSDNINTDNLDFDYRLSGDSPPWKPIRIYNDCVKTYIQMPRTMKQNEAPVLLALDNAGEEKIVNYRLQGDRFIVDKIFDKAILILGVGRNQQKVEIIKGTTKRATNLQLLQ